MVSKGTWLYLIGVAVYVLISGLSYKAVSQDFTAGDVITLQVNNYALIDTNHAPVNMSLAPSIAGEAAQPVSNSDMFIRLSSIVPGGTHREVSVRIVSGAVPSGTFLSLQAANCTTTNSGGSLGVPNATPVYLSAVDQNILTLVGSCYTGTGYNDGYQLTFVWGPDGPESNYHLIESTPEPVNLTIVFTLTAHDGN